MERYFVVNNNGTDYHIIWSTSWTDARILATEQIPGWRAMFSAGLFNPELFNQCLGVIE